MAAQQGNRSDLPRNVLTRSACIQFHKWGTCGAGDRCPYAHTTSGGSMYGPPQRIDVAQGNPGRTVACRYFSGGNLCPYGNACQFLHEGSRGEYRESDAITIATTGGGHTEARKRARSSDQIVDFNMPGESKRPLRAHYNMPHEPKGHVTTTTPFEPRGSSVDSRKPLKTRLCNNWEMTGTCFYGSFCHFAHGAAELQNAGSFNNQQQLGTSASQVSSPALAKFLAPNEEGPSVPSEKRLRFKCNDVHKIAKVYGDWIESPPRDP